MRHLRDILLEKEISITKKGKDGTYIAVRFSRDTQNALKKLAKEIGVGNVVPRDKMHCTVVYSTTAIKDFTIKGKMDELWIGKPTKLEIFPTQSGKRALVLRFECKELEERHKYFHTEYDAKYDYDEYKIHATLSYDVGEDWEIPKVDVTKLIDKIEICEEYYEELNLDWVNSDDSKDKDDDK